MFRVNAARPALAAWLLAAAPTLAHAQASAPSGPQSAPSGAGIANGNPQQEVVGAPEPPGLGVTHGGQLENTAGTAANYVLRF